MSTYIMPPALTERTSLVGVLQQLQAAIKLAEPEKKNTTLTDVARFVANAQETFGADRDLEIVIQMLVAQDLTWQIRERRTSHEMIQVPLVLASQES